MTDAKDRRPDPIPPPREPDPPRPAGAATPADIAGDHSLLGLIDRLAAILDRSDLQELEVESGGTALLLRKPGMAPSSTPPPAPPEPPMDRGPAGSTGSAVSAGPATAEAAPAVMTVKAPLTGLFYASPSPGAAPYLRVGGEVAVGQVIGLIEAMKLFNEIKSDLSGRVARIVADNGALVKAKQPLLEVDPQ